jgi:CubicO group peptidase (beta-lactamase class C family)
VPGVSVAVIHHGAIDWAKGYGVLRLKGPVVNPATLFQAASISKPVTATAVLRLVQEHKLSLDEDLNDRLRSWKVPNNQFTATHKVTLREILSHSAGISVHGFPGYASSETVPTLIQVLNGEKPANTPPIRVISDPGSTWSYSGGGFVILQQELLDITGRSFAELMRKEVLDPLGMTHSTFEQPLPPRLAVFAATPYRLSGKAVDGGWHTYPEMAAAGLWTTPSDLARFAIALQQSLAGNRNAVLNADVAKQMMTKQKQDWGLGVQLGGSDQSARFQHSGGNEGFRCFLVAYEHSGDGAVVMTNSDSGDRVAKALIRSIAHEYRWPDFKPKKRELAHVSTSLYTQYVGQYQIDPEIILTIKRAGEHLRGQITDELPSEIYPESSNKFFATDDDLEITFLRNSADSVNVAEIRFSGQRIRAPKIKPAPRNK